MLTFLLGIHAVHKREYIHEAISTLLDQGENVILLVPEQSSFDRDRAFLTIYGEQKGNRLRVTDFTHFAADTAEQYGIPVKKSAEESAKAILMSLSLEEMSETSPMFTPYKGRLSSVRQLTAAYNEMKQTGLSTDLLRKASAYLQDNAKEKALELSYVFDTYEAGLKAGFSDTTDTLKTVQTILREHHPFENTVIFLDDFRGFTGVQTQFVIDLAAGCKNCFLSVSAPSLADNENNEPYRHALRNAEKIRKGAVSNGVRVFERNTDNPDDTGDLAQLRRCLFKDCKPETTHLPEHIHILSADNPKAECDAVAIHIQKLLKQGYRCRDIGILERDNLYAPFITESLKKYGIPVFEDTRRPLFSSPLIRFVTLSVGLAATGLDTRLLLSQIKTGMTGIGTDDCSLLENYAFCWQINGSRWETPFTGHPDGFGNLETEKSREQLKKINAIREAVILPLITLRNELKKTDGQNDCVALFDFIKTVNAADYFRQYAEHLLQNNDEAGAMEASVVWDTLVSSLDALYTVSAGRHYAPARFYELTELLFGAATSGEIPSGLDEIMLGKADRTRFVSAKAVFILGCNDGIFPQSPRNNGIFTPAQLRKLSGNGFNPEALPEDRFREERLITIEALTSPAELLFVGFSSHSTEGVTLEKSEIITELTRIFPEIPIEKASDIPLLDRITTPAAAFDVYAHLTDKKTETALSLRKALEQDEFYADKLKTLDYAGEKPDFFFRNPALSTELFGKNLYFSVSKAESYHKCPFMFFCRYGMGAEKNRHSTIDARINGLLVHKVLEDVLGIHSSAELSRMTENEITALAEERVRQFIKDSLSDEENLTGQVKRELERCKKRVTEILIRIAMEFTHCSFKTIAVEMKIGDDGEIPAYRLKLPGGGSLTLTGSIDRVDTMETGEGTYLRVVDYKTGGKEFKLSDVFDGLSMQMLLYLFALMKNETGKFNHPLPAGILYLPANTKGTLLGRHADDTDVLKQKITNGRMNGMLLYSADVIKGMETAAMGTYIDAYIEEETGELRGNFLTLDEFYRLNRKIDRILTETAEDIQNGKIKALPLNSGSISQCTYCDYQSVCLHEEGDSCRSPLNIKHGEAVTLLNSEVENDG